MDTTIIEESRQFCSTASTLMQEYTKKLDSLRKDAEDLVRNSEQKSPNSSGKRDAQLVQRRWHVIYMAFARLKDGLIKLARSTSQRLEHANLDEATRLELTVRLADFEAALERAEMTISNAQSEIMH